MDQFPEFITRLPEVDIPWEGVGGHLLQGEQLQVVFLHFQRQTVVPEHSHQAQWELVLAAEVELNLEGKRTTYRPGQSFFIPAGAVHGAVVHAGYRAIVFFDQVDRYRTK